MPATRGLGWVLVALGALAAAGSLTDSSFFTHLATGRIIWEHGVPRSDPYLFTAVGEPWVVQSWFASVLYGGLDRSIGAEGIRLLNALTGAAIAGGTWVLSRPGGTLTARVAAVLPVLAIGFTGWVERPLLFGLAGLVGLLLAAEGHLDPRWLVPITWCWVNTHGSWPLGGVLVVLLLVGRRLDGGDTAVERRTLLWHVVGLAVAVANPYGVRLLLFPFELLSHREALSGLREWQPPTYERSGEQVFLLLLLVAVVALARRRTWRAALPLVVFAGLALTGSRNVLPASVVFVPGIAAGLAGYGTVGGASLRRLQRPLVAVAAALGAVTVLVTLTSDPFDERAYPLGADQWLRDNDLDPVAHRVLAREAVGNWWELRYGAHSAFFVDDRIEVLPIEVVRDQSALLQGDDDWEAVLERYEPEAVLWQLDLPLADLLAGDEDWEIAYRDDRFLVAVPAP